MSKEPYFISIYKDRDIKLTERLIPMQDSTDIQRTIILEIGNKQFGFDMAFGKLLNTWNKKT